ncbi:MAG: hypothetical protein HGA55_04400, partial [Methanoregulaceae archaeon]|nr:hypothetical protein [Methanoregulaceae archaeon]
MHRPDPGFASHAIDLPEALTGRILDLATAANVTPSTVMMAAWSLVTGLLTGEPEPVFGTTVSGRTAPIDGVDRLVGDLSNAVPVRIGATPDLRVTQWFQGIRDQQFEMQPHEHAALDDGDTLHVAYFSSAGNLMHAARSGGSWTTRFVDRPLVANQRNASIGAEGAVSNEPFRSGVTDFYLTNPIARASKTMADCAR